MQNHDQIDIHNFLYRRHRYCGQFTPENMVFNANLQEFANRVGYISNLETAGKLSQQESYKQIESLWQELKRSYSALGISSDAENDLGIGD